MQHDFSQLSLYITLSCLHNYWISSCQILNVCILFLRCFSYKNIQSREINFRRYFVRAASAVNLISTSSEALRKQSSFIRGNIAQLPFIAFFAGLKYSVSAIASKTQYRGNSILNDILSARALHYR